MGHKKNRLGINIYDQSSFNYLQESGFIANTILTTMVSSCIEGSTSKELSSIALDLMNKFKVKPAFMGFENYPDSVCISYNEKIVHGIPNEYKFKNGDVVSIDFGVIHKGHYSDNARTIVVGHLDNEHSGLVDIAKTAFLRGMAKAYVGSTTGDIGYAIHKEILKSKINLDPVGESKYKLYYRFQGHGIGMALHELPSVPNIGFPNKGYLIEAGMCICIEPVVLYSSSNPLELKTNFDKVIEIVTDDRKPSSHHENQIFITEDGPIILTRSSN
jgi:methionyl aminopeptidase